MKLSCGNLENWWRVVPTPATVGGAGGVSTYVLVMGEARFFESDLGLCLGDRTCTVDFPGVGVRFGIVMVRSCLVGVTAASAVGPVSECGSSPGEASGISGPEEIGEAVCSESAVIGSDRV